MLGFSCIYTDVGGYNCKLHGDCVDLFSPFGCKLDFSHDFLAFLGFYFYQSGEK